MSATRKNGSRSAQTRKDRPVKMARSASPTIKTKLSRSTKATIVGGATLFAAAAAATGAVLMRRRLGRLAMGMAADALSAGHSVGHLGNQLGRSVRKEVKGVDLARLLTFAGLKRRPSLLRRLMAPMGVLAAVIAATGSAIFLVAPKLRAASKDVLGSDLPTPPSKYEGVTDGVVQPTYVKTNGSISDIGDGVAYAAK
jgi:hypothetical protein